MAGNPPLDAGCAEGCSPRDGGGPLVDSGSPPALDAGSSADAAAPSDAATLADGAPVGANGRRDGVGECYSAFSNGHPAVLRERKVFHGGDFEARASMIQELEAAAAAHPDEEQFVLLAGIMNLWRIVEPHGLQTIAVLDLLETADKAEHQLELAYALCPTDHRIAGWLGPLRIVLGQNIGDQAKIDAGRAVLKRGIEHYPEFVRFTQLIVGGELPTNDPEFNDVLDAMMFYRSFCNNQGGDRVCGNNPLVLHNVEGTTLAFGDILARAQLKAEALEAYEFAKKPPEFKTWHYREQLEERIRTVDQRIAAAATPDPSDDLQTWTTMGYCSLCHRE